MTGIKRAMKDIDEMIEEVERAIAEGREESVYVRGSTAEVELMRLKRMKITLWRIPEGGIGEE